MKKLFLLIVSLPLLSIKAAQQPTTSYPTGQTGQYNYQAPFQDPWKTLATVKKNLGITPEQEQKFKVGLQKLKDWFNQLGNQDWVNRLKNRFFPPKYPSTGPQLASSSVSTLQPAITTASTAQPAQKGQPVLTKDIKQAEYDIAQLQKTQAQRTGSITAKELQERRQGLRPVQREPLKFEESALLRDIKAKLAEFEQAKAQRALNPVY